MIVNLNGIGFHVEMVGEGYPFVLLHGFTGDGTTWQPFIEKWSRYSKLIIVDIIGHGKTDAPKDSERYKMEAAVTDLDCLLKHLNFEKTDMLGYSMGGRLALSYATAFPNKVRKLILESTSPGLKTAEERARRRENDEKLSAFIIEKGMDAFVDYWEKIPLFQTQTILPTAVKENIRKQRLSNAVIGLSGSLKGMGTGAQHSCWEELERLHGETLILTGALDKKFCQIAIEMQEKVKNSTRVVVEDCGHAIHVEQSEKFGTIVEEFLK